MKDQYFSRQMYGNEYANLKYAIDIARERKQTDVSLDRISIGTNISITS
jgi:hypothetical protein